jgi:hypothetical protein
LNQKEQKGSERAARHIVRSILALPMSPLPVDVMNKELGLWVDAKSTKKYRWRTTALLQKNLGSERSAHRLYMKKKGPQRMTMKKSRSQRPKWRNSTQRLLQFSNWYLKDANVVAMMKVSGPRQTKN